MGRHFDAALDAKRAAKLREWRDAGMTMAEMGARLKLTKSRVWQLCRHHGITSDRDLGPKPKFASKRTRYYVPPVDPEKARQITDAKKRYWLGAA